MISSLMYSRTTTFFPFFHCLYTCFLCILSQLDCGQIFNKRRILRCGACQREALIRGWFLFWSKSQCYSAYLKLSIYQRELDKLPITSNLYFALITQICRFVNLIFRLYGINNYIQKQKNTIQKRLIEHIKLIIN